MKVVVPVVCNDTCPGPDSQFLGEFTGAALGQGSLAHRRDPTGAVLGYGDMPVVVAYSGRASVSAHRLVLVHFFAPQRQVRTVQTVQFPVAVHQQGRLHPRRSADFFTWSRLFVGP